MKPFQLSNRNPLFTVQYYTTMSNISQKSKDTETKTGATQNTLNSSIHSKDGIRIGAPA